MRKSIKTALACFSVVCCMAAPLNAKDATTVFENVSSSIVVIETFNEQGKQKGLGSGVVISLGVVATNHHVIDSAKKIMVKHKGKEYAAALLHSDKDRDVCTLTVAGLTAPAVVFGSTRVLKTGARVYAVGAPQGLDLSLSDGI
jgi:S1-C subfamily serine protease